MSECNFHGVIVLDFFEGLHLEFDTFGNVYEVNTHIHTTVRVAGICFTQIWQGMQAQK